MNVLDVENQIENHFLIKSAIDALEQQYPDNITLVEEKEINHSFLIKQDLMLISLDSWEKLIDSQSPWLNDLPSVLIIKP